MKIAFTLLLYCFTLVLSGQTDVRQVGAMPEGVWETSGLLFHKGKLITHNDSGNSAQLFEIDTLTMAITRSVSISNAENDDWEDIAQDDSYFYIADFGNNVGVRQNLRVYRISKNTYDSVDTVSADEIGFAYEDQTDFENTGNSDWDAEALFVLDDQLIILTKQWQSNNTVAYSIPKIPGNHTARKIDDYAINGLVTAASYNAQTKILYILGYNSLLGAFIERVTGATTTSIFGDTVTRLETNIGFAQTEGITYASNTNYLISSERFEDQARGIDIPSTLFSFSTNDTQTITPNPETNSDFVLFRQFGSNQLQYQLQTDQPVLGWAIFDAMGRRVRFTYDNLIEIQSIDVSTLHPAIYYFSLYLGGETLSQGFAID